MLRSLIQRIVPNVPRIRQVPAHIKRFKSSYLQKKISCVVQTNHVGIGHPPDSYYNTKDHPANFTSITLLEGSKPNVISYYNVNDTYDRHILKYEKPGDYATITVNDKGIPTNIKLTNVYKSGPSAKLNHKSQVVDMSFETHKIKKEEKIHLDFYTYQHGKPQNPLIYLCTPIDNTNDGINFRYEYNTRYPYNDGLSSEYDTYYAYNSHYVHNEEQSYEYNTYDAYNDEQSAKNRLTLYFNKNPVRYYLIVLYNSEYDIYNCGGSSRQLEIHQISVSK